MINATKQFYQNKNLIENSLVSKQQQIDLIAKMIRNNLKSYFATGYYKTDINPKLDELSNFSDIQKYISSLDYSNTLYFYGASIVELIMFENNLIEKNVEIKEASRNASVIRHILETKDTSHKLCSNFYVVKSDLKNVILNVYFDLFNTKVDHNSLNNKLLKEMLICFEENFETKLTPIDVYTKLLYLTETVELGNLFDAGIQKLNKEIQMSSGIVAKTSINKNNVAKTLNDMQSVIGSREIAEHIEIIKQNKDLITLLDFEVEVDSNDEDIVDDIEITYSSEDIL